MTFRTIKTALMIAAVVILGVAPAHAAWKPDKPVSLIVPSSPGGGHDSNARLVAQFVEKHAGVPISIVNQAAGGGVVGITNMMKAQPNGLTLGQVSISLVSDQYLVSGAQYDQDSFKYIGLIAEDPNCLVVSKKKGVLADADIKQFMEYAKANPERIRMGVSGHWTNHDYTRYQLEQAWDVKFQRVSIKGGANIVLSIMAGDLEAGVPYPSEVMGPVQAGEIKVLALNGSQRSEIFPDVPTFLELGYDVNMPIWRVWVLPKKTPEEIVKGWEAILKAAMNDPELIEGCKRAGVNRAYKDSAGAYEAVRKSHDQYKKIIEEAGLAKK